MREQQNSRIIVLAVVLFIAFAALVVRLGNLQITNVEEYTSLSDSRIHKTIKTYGVRGKILDANGTVLAENVKTFDLEFYRTNTKSSETVRNEYTQAILTALDILEEHNYTMESTFNIKKNDNGEYVFDFGDISAEAAKNREKYWRNDLAIQDQTPEEIYELLLERYVVPEDVSEERKSAVLGIWQDSIRNASVGAITVAEDLDTETVASLELASNDLSGFNVVESNKRIYPYGTTAAHVIGYIGKINTESQLAYYVDERGYRPSDVIGVAGIEGYMEDYLTGVSKDKQGEREVEVNSKNVVTKVIREEAYKNGNNVMLTLDIELQSVLENALEENIKTIRAEQEKRYNANLDEYKEIEERNGKPIKMASVGAAVVMNVKNGEVLAMASYPSFDPSLFVGGISNKDYQQIVEDERAPLLNKAVSSKGTPGSIFKMVTAVAGLSEGKISLSERISDEGYFDKYAQKEGTGPHCWINHYSIGMHADQSVSDALKHSCNYFFFEVADRLKIDLLQKWAYNFGLTSKTGIELLNETSGQIGGQETLYDVNKEIDDQDTAKPLLVQRKLKQIITEAVEESDGLLTDLQIDAGVLKLMQLVGTSQGNNIFADTALFRDICTILTEEMKIPKSIVNSELAYHVRDYLGELKWWPIDTVTTGIGQSVTEVTPIGVARYISSLVNGGFVYEATLIKEIQNPDGTVLSGKSDPEIFNVLKTEAEYLEEVKKGMKQVVSDDDATAQSAFKDFKYKDNMGGKSGTAEVSTVDLECNSWFVAFAPYEEPEIAVVVFIPNGLSGGMSSTTVQAAIAYWMETYHAEG